ncbi:MAG: enoyl-CoA hydratase/isomerase family protein [Gemmatimonadales bacterium]|jgi:3-hydroxyacyl-CoA dehydrogenase/enoyl-CoA hydratase/3-hydroxybutyryl-CoA epimerase|nr:MAG: enoyl-CoA hydratase/isomerase family protein [Gemmatimonadales bacterium]
MADRSPSPLLTLDPEGVAWITFADPDRKLNVLDEGVMRRLAGHIQELASGGHGSRVRAVVVFSGKIDSFLAGADVDAIRNIQGPSDGEVKARLGQEIYTQLADLSLPTVAAIHGICLGGGLELALACDYRILSSHPKTRLGLPEVQLGILPGWGGTTRLPRLVGLRASLDLLLTGKQVRPDAARRMGLADVVLPPEGFREGVRRFALRAAEGQAQGGPRRSGVLARLLDGTGPGRRVVLRAARKKVLEQTLGHYPAPLKILDVLQEGGRLPVDRALEIEARAFGELTATTTHHNLLHVYSLREDAKKVDRRLPGSVTSAVARMGVIGAGVMGGGIAQLAAHKGISVRMKDIRDDAVSGGLRHARELFSKEVARRRMTRQEAEVRMARISGTLDYRGFEGLDLVVEAVVERMEVKKSVLAETEERVRPDTILATNTSSLSVDEMASALKRPDRFCGMHFFNPVHRMPLVEIIRGEQTSADTLSTVHALAIRMGKVPVLCGDGPGFLVNRILGPYLNEAGHLLTEGVAIQDVDRAATEFGMPMGPVRLLDEVGIDVARHAGETLHEAFGARMAPAPVLERLAPTDRLGRKNERGFYRYREGRDAGVDESVYSDLRLPDPEPGALAQEEIRRRLVLVMINEAARILEDGIVERAADVDVGMIMGTGFPPFRGGLLRFSDHQHPRSILEKLWEMEGKYGTRFTPAPLLVELARDNRGFYRAFGGP